jgi:aspartyl-tRNA(Asn)/glutamyl-tRNA(Gln) amidotransferase subunit C
MNLMNLLKGGTGKNMLTLEDLKRIASTAKINITDEERNNLLKEMNDAIGSFNLLENIDTKEVKPLELVTTKCNVYREDIVEKSYNKEDILANAPNAREGYFSVPQIVE